MCVCVCRFGHNGAMYYRQNCSEIKDRSAQQHQHQQPVAVEIDSSWGITVECVCVCMWVCGAHNDWANTLLERITFQPIIIDRETLNGSQPTPPPPPHSFRGECIQLTSAQPTSFSMRPFAGGMLVCTLFHLKIMICLIRSTPIINNTMMVVLFIVISGGAGVNRIRMLVVNFWLYEIYTVVCRELKPQNKNDCYGFDVVHTQHRVAPAAWGGIQLGLGQSCSTDADLNLLQWFLPTQIHH